MAEVKAFRRSLRQNVKKYGWSATAVEPDAKNAGYTYTIGLWRTAKRPEIYISGLEPETAHEILAAIVNFLKNAPPLKVGVPVHDVLYSDFFAFPIEKSRYSGLLSSANWFYGGHDYPCVQVVYPDPKGCFPWQEECHSTFKAMQPDLTAEGWRALLVN